MLEQRLNDLDLEYIKVSSEFLLDFRPKMVNARMKNLALKGELNALGFWYNYNQPGDCKELDEMVSKLEGYSYDECYALGLYYWKQEVKKYCDLADKFNAYKIDYDSKKGNVVGWTTCSRCSIPIYQDVSKEKELVDNTYDEVMKLNFVKNLKKAREQAFTLGTAQGNMYLLQKAYNIDKALYELTSIGNKPKREYNLLVREYLKLSKKGKKSLSVKDDPQFCYHFARAVFFAEGRAINKLRPKAVQLLRELSDMTIVKEDEKQ